MTNIEKRFEKKERKTLHNPEVLQQLREFVAKRIESYLSNEDDRKYYRVYGIAQKVRNGEKYLLLNGGKIVW